jgi:Protein of unknown function (DUF3592)
VLFLVPLAFALFGLGLVWAAFSIRRGDRRFARHARQTTGTVIGARWRGGGGETAPSAFPVVRFELPDGRTIEAQSSYGGRTAVPEGATVTVLYDPAEPTRIELEGGRATGTFLAVILGFIGAGFFCLGAFGTLVLLAIRDAM